MRTELGSTTRPRICARRFLCIFAAFTIILTLFVIDNANRTPIERHLSRLGYLKHGPFLQPKNTREWLSRNAVRYLHWTLSRRMEGQPATFNDWTEALEAEQQALIQLGYYERRWINLPPACNVDHASLKATFVGRTPFTMHGDIQRPAQIRITARPAEIHEFAAVVATIPR